MGRYPKSERKSEGIQIKTTHLLVLLLLGIIVLAYAGVIQISFFDVTQYVKREEPTPPPTDDLVSVTKPLKFYVTDYFAGGGISGMTVGLYDTSFRALETGNTDGTGVRTTSSAYRSGTKLFVKVTGGTGELRWYELVVPQMSRVDAESLDYNGPITLEFYDYAAPTIQVRDNFGNSYADGGNWNKTAGGRPGTSIATCTVMWFQSADNKGLLPSYDPINSVNLDAWLIVKVHGAGYENVLVSGFPYSVEKGTAMYYGYKIPYEQLCRWKVGATYRLEGTGSFSFTIDLTGYSGTAADLDIFIYYFADWNHFVAKGSLGPDALSVIAGAPHTLNLIAP